MLTPTANPPSAAPAAGVPSWTSAGDIAPGPTLAKIVATIGPSSESPEMVRRLIEAGVGIFRFNFSHGDFDAHGKRLRTVREVAASLGRPIACLGDLQGPKIRVGKVAPPGIEIKAGQDVLFRRGVETARLEPQDGGEPLAVFGSTFAGLYSQVQPGQKVLINDGAIRMLAVDRSPERGELRCRVTIGGLVTSGKGINLPQSEITAPAITERDLECVAWAVENQMDFLALSFVRKAEEVLELKERLAGMLRADRDDGESPWIPVIAKIEKPQALRNLEAIVKAADGIMVARGDLGVEMDIARVPVAQKEIVAMCTRWGRPCIVATQMLETMIENASPTRAEASDVANAIFDGADAVMLSAETATGKHPALVVETMRRIVGVAEQRMCELPRRPSPPQTIDAAHAGIAALAHGAWYVANDVGARAIVCWSQAGGTARYLSQNGFHVPIIAYSSSHPVTRRMALLGGVTPVYSPPPASGTLREWNEAVDEYLLRHGLARAGETVVLVTGKPLGKAKATNAVAIHRVGDAMSGYRYGGN